MAVTQIPTSVSIIASLKGFMAVSLNEYTTSAEASIAAGSIVEVNGAFFQFTTDTIPSDWSTISTHDMAYIAIAPSGTAGSQILTAYYTATAPTWRDDLQGWYATAASNIRVIGAILKDSSTAYINKTLFLPAQSAIPTARMVYAKNTILGPSTADIIYRDLAQYFTADGIKIMASGGITVSGTTVILSNIEKSGSSLVCSGLVGSVFGTVTISSGSSSVTTCALSIMI